MRFLLLLLFIAVPLAEIAVLIKVGEAIGIGATIALVVLTAVVGVALLKRQGLAAMARAQEAVQRGELPVDSVIDGVCLLVAGALLLTPGLITDTAGFLLLVPQFRRRLARALFERLVKSGNVHVTTFGPGPGPGPGREPPSGRPPGAGPVIEGEFEEVDAPEPERNRKRGSGRASPWRGPPDTRQ